MRLSRSPTLRSLRAFCVAARSRSFRVAADEIFSTLMGEKVEPRRDFIRGEARKVRNLDI